MRFLPLLAVCFAQQLSAQHLTHREWLEQSFRDIRLLPAYGGRDKNAEQRASDSTFVAQMLAQNPDRHLGAEHLLDLGFGLLREGNMVHAMYRFNQAYLLEPLNPRIRRAYGAFFVALDRSGEAATEYQKGLELDSANVPLMLNMSSVCLTEYYNHRDTAPDKATQLLNTATVLLKRAVALEPKNAAALFKLSVCHLRKGECTEARDRYAEALALDPTGVDQTFGDSLKRECPAKP